MSTHADQEKRLKATIDWAHKVRECLSPLQCTHGDRVHFRPASTGVSLVGLLPDRPQRGKSGLTNLDNVAANFEKLFEDNCITVDQGRVTGEKALQSFLIREAYVNNRRMASLNAASSTTDAPVDLWFVTDELALPLDDGKIVCDILALHRDGNRLRPVLLELKDDRQLTRLVEQVDSYSRLMDKHDELFGELYGTILGEQVTFDGLTEKWIKWPTAGKDHDPREAELAQQGIRVVGYTADSSAGYQFRVGCGVS
jgi:hypothetical protein